MRKCVSSCRMQMRAAGWQPEEGKGWGELGRVEWELGWVESFQFQPSRAARHVCSGPMHGPQGLALGACSSNR